MKGVHLATRRRRARRLIGQHARTAGNKLVCKHLLSTLCRGCLRRGPAATSQVPTRGYHGAACTTAPCKRLWSSRNIQAPPDCGGHRRALAGGVSASHRDAGLGLCNSLEKLRLLPSRIQTKSLLRVKNGTSTPQGAQLGIFDCPIYPAESRANRLTGAVAANAEREAAERDAWCIFGVDNVLNEIKVMP